MSYFIIPANGHFNTLRCFKIKLFSEQFLTLHKSWYVILFQYGFVQV